jgi:hypothetical protein
LRVEFLAGRMFNDLADAQQLLDHWVASYNHDRPHQGIGMLTPADRFASHTTRQVADLDPHLEALAEARSSEDWITRKVSVHGVITVAAAALGR